MDTWDSSDGLPQIRIRAIIQTRDGYLWLGTGNGLVRFDGVNFMTFDVHSGSLKDNEIGGLVEGDDGALWIGTYGGGLTRYKDGQFTTFTTADGLPDNSVRKLDKDRAGNIWMATPKGVGCFSKGKFTAFSTRDGLAGDFIASIGAQCPRGILAVTDGRLCRLVEGRFITETGALEAVDGRIDSMVCGRDDSVWMTLENSRIKNWKNGRMTTYTQADFKNNRPGAIYEDAQTNVWIATRDGLVRFHAGRFEALTTPAARAKLGVVESICADREGDLWLGTEANGLVRLRVVAARILTAEDGLAETSTRCVYRDRRGDIWVGCYLGFSRLRQGAITAVKQLDGNTVPTVTSICEDLRGRVWIACGGHLLIQDKEQFAPLPGWTNVFDIKVISCDRRGDMWVGTDGDGLFRFSNGQMTAYRTRDGLMNNQIRAIYEDRRGVIWVGTTTGLSRFQDGNFTNYSARDGLSNSRIMCLCEDTNGNLWAGTRSGISRLRDGHFSNLSQTEGLPDNYVFNLLDDGHGRFWLSSGKGLSHLDQAELNAVADGRKTRVEPVVLGYRDGVRNASLVAGTQPNACVGDHGRLLFCSLNGLVEVSPIEGQPNLLPPPVFLQQVLINHKRQSVEAEPRLQPGSCELEIHYAALSYVAPEKVLFKYQLEGLDTDWVEAGQRRFANYAHLPPGTYRFHVIACNNDGLWNTRGAVYSFRVPPRFYQTAWFPVLVLALLAGLAGGGYAWQMRRLQRREAELQRRVDEAVAQVKVLHGLLPICTGCKKIRDDQGYWNQIENYIARHADIKFSHSLCPDCLQRLYPDLADEVLREVNAPKPATPPPDPGGPETHK
jgi:ligand-binding sensor domain-containing protein